MMMIERINIDEDAIKQKSTIKDNIRAFNFNAYEPMK